MTATSTLTRKAAPKNDESVVTPDRFATGMPTFADWMASIEKNADLFQRHYDEFTPKAEDVAALKGWRRELFGEEALRVKRGEVAITVIDGEIATVKRT